MSRVTVQVYVYELENPTDVRLVVAVVNLFSFVASGESGQFLQLLRPAPGAGRSHGRGGRGHTGTVKVTVAGDRNSHKGTDSPYDIPPEI
jgi:hypothetical protein